ncbi:hypothetical protein SAMN04489737_1384 [Arcanobacterium phocae]|uniref:Uncharacterized protein n=1 Tax=Arcanobacterium phocae TaxID=131112 RepID=A0A1H2LJV4_9ACTO|nr:hypothetical protein SAMN04489737_1384 [Arcanobacterium phocae]
MPKIFDQVAKDRVVRLMEDLITESARLGRGVKEPT